MDGMLSQEEIDALTGGNSATSEADSGSSSEHTLTAAERDAVGEIANINMGTAATTLSTLLNHKVTITTPRVSYVTMNELSKQYDRPCVFIHISYIDGIDGNNILILKEQDVKIITDLMMGGDGLNPAPELTELHFSAICEAMNQMMGSSATSLSSMLNCKIDISPPEAELVDMAGNIDVAKASDFLDKDFVRVTFRMTIGDLVDSTIMQLYPIQFARDLYKKFSGESEEKEETPPPAPQPEPQPQPQPQPATGMPMGQPMMGQSMMPQMMQPDVNVQNVQFQAFNPVMNPALQQENIDLIMDVPLEVSVVLGRTRKSIKEILEFAPGTIIELDKLAGEPIDVMVNQKLVAKGEVVVIEESFGIRITEIIKEKI